MLREVPSTYVYPVDGHIPFNIHKGTPTLLALMLPSASFQNPQGVACALLASTDNPKDPLDDVEITVLGVNSGAGEIFYNVGLRNVKKMGSVGKGMNQFRNPQGVALHRSGAAAVADMGNHRIVLLKHDGYRLSWVRAEGREGSEIGQFKGPRGVAFDSRGNLYVADTLNHRIQARTVDGKWRVLVSSGLQEPSALAVIDGADPWTYFTSGPYADRLAVIDQQGQRLQTFSLSGAPLAAWSADTAAIGDGPYHLTACVFDYFGHLVVTDDAKSCLRKFDRDVRPLAVFGSLGDDDYQFRKPRGIALHKQLGQMVVSEEESVQYLWVGADALDLKADNIPGAVAFRFFLTEAASVSAVVKGVDGTPITVVAKDVNLDERNRTLLWTPSSGTRKGSYVLNLTVMATYSSRDRLAKTQSMTFTYNGLAAATVTPTLPPPVSTVTVLPTPIPRWMQILGTTSPPQSLTPTPVH